MEEALQAGPLRDGKIGITGPLYSNNNSNNYWIRKKEGEKPFECWPHEQRLGSGAFGEVWCVVCKEGAANYGQVRAVKKISKKQEKARKKKEERRLRKVKEASDAKELEEKRRRGARGR
ncbi:hypothetical protein QBC32DRAFT_309644 [Pseudoneurospora amorphoporcata]|uniref:Protein kinase domain-containing protein n=1 Tax=Pseudoneurospora amorphoporcata TaxID=241081 RepID=A0AAN6P329_9PEZI|nr:hypothetical protein QBC32DRAFT_309644 [Pseudoneurospora amorphoporcata]